MHIEPRTHQTIHVDVVDQRELYEGEVRMSQEQQDQYKALIGDGLGKVTIAREVSESNYGQGGRVFVSVTLSCDQSESGLGQALALANRIAEGTVWHYHSLLKTELVRRGILK